MIAEFQQPHHSVDNESNHGSEHTALNRHIAQSPKLKYYLIGNSISHSLSPTIHNAGFTNLKLPHQYAIFEVPSADDDRVRDLLFHDPSFGGASVTFPHKLHVQQYLHSFSDEAQLMGAVNTILVTPAQPSLTGSRSTGPTGRTLHGENTDWIGIRNCLLAGNPSGKFDDAVIVGAGGAARAAVFALQALGVRKLKLVNRTRRKAEAMMADFDRMGKGMEFQIYDRLTDVPPAEEVGGERVVGAIVSCIPADHVTDRDIPTHMFENGLGGGIVVEMAYREHKTALMRVAESEGGGRWKVFGGVDVLMEQGFAQFEMWTGREAPVAVMRKAVQDEVERQKAE